MGDQMTKIFRKMVMEFWYENSSGFFSTHILV